MKYQELKQRFKHKYVIRMAAGVLIVALLGTGAGMYSYARSDQKTTEAADGRESGMLLADKEDTDLSEADDETKEEVLSKVLGDQTAQTDRKVGKEETVYVVADAAGKTRSVIVSEWLKNPEESGTLKDASDLTDIKNVKGDETFTEEDGGGITWQADGKDIYYQGTTNRELPVELKITYTLDGKVISPEELAGKSGKVAIRMDYTNHETVKASINGKEEEVAVPFTAVTGMILSDKFTNVEVTNGKLLTDGKNQVAVGIAMPGLKDSLKADSTDFDTEIEIPDYVEVTADVEDFSLDMTMTMIMSDILSDLTLSDSLDLDELTDSIDTLSDASAQLVDGSGELAEGLGTLNGSLKEYAAGVDTLKNGVNNYTKGAATLNEGIAALKNGSDALVDGAGTLAAGVDKISDSFTAQAGLLNGANALAAGVNQLDAALNTAMTEEEKQAVKAQADTAVEQTFANGMADQIAGQAAKQFEATMNASGAAIGQQLCDSELYDTMVEALYQQKIFEAYQAQKATVDLAIQNYASQGVTVTIADVIEGAYQQQTGHTIRSEVEAGVTRQLKDAVAPQIAAGIAAGGSQAMGESVAAACEEAAKTAAGLAAVTGAEGAKAQIAAQIRQGGLTAGANALSAGVSKLYQEGISPLKSGVDAMVSQMPALTDGIRQLSDGSSTLVSNNAALTDGAKKLSGATDQLTDGAGQLLDGADRLSDGMTEFDRDGIQKLADTYHGDVQSLLDRLEAIVDAGKQYQTFTRLPDGMEGSVKFMIRTEAVKAE